MRSPRMTELLWTGLSWIALGGTLASMANAAPPANLEKHIGEDGYVITKEAGFTPLGVDARYYRFIRRNPPLGHRAKAILGKYSPLPGRWDYDLAKACVQVVRAVPLDERSSQNALIHALMAFGPEHPVSVGGRGAVGVLPFLQRYYGYLPPDVRPWAPKWILKVGDYYVMPPGELSRVLSDHLGQLFYATALWNVPLTTPFQTKDGTMVPLGDIFRGELAFSGPGLRIATWQAVAVARYWPLRRWTNVYGQAIDGVDYVEDTLVTESAACGHTHSYISAAYAIPLYLHANYDEADRESRRLRWHKKMIPHIDMVKRTLCRDGSVSPEWYLGKSRHPVTSQGVTDLNGHVLEWISQYLGAKELSEPWARSIAGKLCNTVLRTLGKGDADGRLLLEYESLCHASVGLERYIQKTSVDQERNVK